MFSIFLYFVYFWLQVALLTTSSLLEDVTSKTSDLRGVERERVSEWGFHLLCQVRSESMSKRGEVDILMTTKWTLGHLEKYLLKRGNWVIEFWFELEKYFSLHKKKFRVFLCCLSVSPEYFGLDAFESSQRHERPHQSLFNISDRFCLTKPFYS